MSQSRHRLDAVDLAILNQLQAEGRISNVDLAERVGLSAPPCLRRVKALEDAGFIRGYYAELDNDKLGYPCIIYVRVSLKRQAEADLQAFEAYVVALPEVRECYMLSGEIDFLLKVVAPTIDAWRSFQTAKLKPLRNIASLKTSLSFIVSKSLPGVPVDQRPDLARNSA